MTAAKALDTIENSINRCVRALRKVKLRCFKRIVEEQNLKIPVSDATTAQDLAAAQQIAKIGKENKNKPKVVRSRPKKKETIIDPSQAAEMPIDEVEKPVKPDDATTEQDLAKTRQAAKTGKAPKGQSKPKVTRVRTKKTPVKSKDSAEAPDNTSPG